MYFNYIPIKEKPPTILTIVMTIVISAGLIGSIWNLTKGRLISKIMKDFVKNLSIYDNKLKLPKPLRLSIGVYSIESRYDIERKFRVYSSFTKIKDEEILTDTIEILKSNKITILPRTTTRFIEVSLSSLGIGTYHEILEKVELPAYKIEESNFRSKVGGGVIIATIPKIKHKINFEKSIISVSKGNDYAILELKTFDNGFTGLITYSKPLTDYVSRSVKVKLVVETTLFKLKGKVFEIELFKSDKSGSYEFKFEFPKIDDNYFIICFEWGHTPLKILKSLGLRTSIPIGSFWKYHNVRIELILDIPKGRDEISSSRMYIEPIFYD